MRKVALLACILTAITCGPAPAKFSLGDKVVTVRQCMATSDEFLYEEMQSASDKADDKPLQEMMKKGQLLILNKGQPGTAAWVDKDKTQN